MTQTVQQLENEKDHETTQLMNRIDELQSHMEALIQQHEESLLRAENDKQQALLLGKNYFMLRAFIFMNYFSAHHDIQALQDRLVQVKKDLEEEQVLLDRTKREANSRAEQDRGVMNQLRDELAKLKAKFEDVKYVFLFNNSLNISNVFFRQKSEDEKNHLEARIAETKKERDSAQNDCEELRVQLHLAEDRCENLQTDLQETSFKLKEVESMSENLKKDLNDVRRQLAESTCEKDKYDLTNKELREQIKRVEGEKRDQNRVLEESFQKISSNYEKKNHLNDTIFKVANFQYLRTPKQAWMVIDLAFNFSCVMWRMQLY
jgi:rootletin